jgi:hypothetical protein
MKHEIIYTEHYALIVSDEKIEKYDYVFNPIYKTLYQWIENADIHFDRIDAKKVIAHRPLTDAPILEGVALLPDWEETEETIKSNYYNELEDRREVARNFSGQVAGRHPDMFGHSEIHHMVRGFIDGYNKAKETYKYTEEDLIKAIEMAITSKYEYKLEFYNQNEIIQSLQQPKRPKYFECEMSPMNEGYTDESDYPYQEVEIPKTITNSKNQTELVGEYIYE